MEQFHRLNHVDWNALLTIFVHKHGSLCCKSCNVKVHLINKNHSKMAQNAIYKEVRFKIFLGVCPQTPLAWAAFSNLLVSGLPITVDHLICNISVPLSLKSRSTSDIRLPWPLHFLYPSYGPDHKYMSHKCMYVTMISGLIRGSTSATHFQHWIWHSFWHENLWGYQDNFICKIAYCYSKDSEN